MEEIQEQIQIVLAYIDATSCGDPSWAKHMSYLSHLKYRLHEHTADPVLLDDSISIGLEAIRASKKDDPNRGVRLSAQASRLKERYSISGATEDLKEAIRLTHEAMQLIPDDHPMRAAALIDHGCILRLGGSVADLDEASIVFVEATRITEDIEILFAAQKNLDTIFYEKYRLSGEVTDLELSIRSARSAISLLLDDDKQKAMHLGSLFLRLRDLYHKTHTSEALDEAVTTMQRALDLAPEGDPYYAVTLTNLGTARFDRWQLHGERVDLEASIQLVKSAIALLANEDPLKGVGLRNLSDRLYQRFRITRALDDIRECVEVGLEALAATPTNYPERVRFSSDIALRLAVLYRQTRGLTELNEAIDMARQALSMTRETESWWGQLVDYLNCLLNARYAREGVVADLQEAVQLAERCIEMTCKDHKSYPERLMNLADCMWQRYRSFGVASDIHKAVSLAREALTGLPRGHADCDRFKSSLGRWLGDMFLETGLDSDLEVGIQLAREAYNASRPDEQSHSNYSINLCELLFLGRGTRSAGGDSIDEAIQILKGEVHSMPKDDPNYHVQLMNLSTYLGTRYQEREEDSDLEEAISFARDASHSAESSSTDYFEALNNIGTLIGMRHDRSRKAVDLEEAKQVISEALQSIETSHSPRPSLLNNMANRLRVQFLITGDLDALEDAIHLAREATETEVNRRNKKALYTLGTLLGDRFISTGEIADLNTSIEILESAIADIPANDPDRPGILNNLGIRFGDRYYRTWEIADLDRSIQYTREAVSMTPKRHVEFAARSQNLAARVGDRYRRIGRLTDLEDAIRIGSDLLTSDSLVSNRSAILNNLGIRLNDKYSRTGLFEDLNNAIQHATRAVDVLPPDHLELAGHLKNLGTLLNEKYMRTADAADYTTCVDIGVRALQAAPLGHSLHSSCLSNMARLFFINFQKTGDLAQLEESIRMFREAVDSSPEDHPFHADRLLCLGDVLAEKYVISRDLAVLDESITYVRSASSRANAPLNVRIKASRQWLRNLLVRSQWREAFEAAEKALGLIPELVLRSLDNSDKQHLLGQVAGLACEAASTAIRGAKSPMKALRFLEKGRGVLATSIEDLRTDIVDLQSIQPELVDRFLKCKEEFYSITNRAQDTSVSSQAGQQYECERRFDAVLKDIRTTPGFEDFLLEPDAAKIRAAALQGPIVVINISMFDCGALVVDSRGEWAVSLPRLTKDDLERRARLGSVGSLETLEWLWDAVANPILDYLGLTSTPKDNSWTHIWWVPTGALCKFPLHAAGYHLRKTGETVMDRAISSYSSSVKTLILSRRVPIKKPTPPKALLVAIESTPGCAPLPFARQEVEAIRGICSCMDLNIIEPENKRKADIKPHLQGCNIFHFAGHSHTDETNPSLSHLLLEEGRQNPLTVGELLDMNLKKSSPFLAYLSACGTGRFKDEKFADESLHLIGACQVAGFRHVIGTLWEVQDRLCMDVARGIYGRIRDNGILDESVSHGLHHTIRMLRDIWLRSRTGRTTEAWNRENHDGGIGRAQETGLATREQQQRPRDVVAVEDEGYGDLYWVPYVHFGV
ncbi:uncharacterized protein FFUJ_14165 [Fusarium fujikuroi IMI 58289]|uniref:CHAT domain-containing protein n=1 Tax=Gibberella fujikuroi (strain CBS 195.34 / IMI 58289 / NRRL A-6831) TaxID=1279085 RepID=S0ENB7_GIBF5|nr:uncharacterized protein FFUJ_14165 [Fusarium fujikuroi IMI 58289]CCT76202.1 uncharacterized protein FFUJ_14165 [Fusarium fujikuroi IMI 58289]SCO26773.1 uncharacterized protein FFM5_15042 [Fusarium fujikuroi]